MVIKSVKFSEIENMLLSRLVKELGMLRGSKVNTHMVMKEAIMEKVRRVLVHGYHEVHDEDVEIQGAGTDEPSISAG